MCLHTAKSAMQLDKLIEFIVQAGLVFAAKHCTHQIQCTYIVNMNLYGLIRYFSKYIELGARTSYGVRYILVRIPTLCLSIASKI